jgi:hypothetical protein
VVESRQAGLAIYARSVVLITDTALRVLTATQLQAPVAHEIGHEYVWDEFEARARRPTMLASVNWNWCATASPY